MKLLKMNKLNKSRFKNRKSWQTIKMRRHHVGNKNVLRLQSLVSEEDEDEDEEEGKTAVQADEKMKNNKPGLHGAVLLLLINKKLVL